MATNYDDGEGGAAADLKTSSEDSLLQTESESLAEQLRVPQRPPSDSVVPDVPRQQGDGATHTETNTDVKSLVDFNNPFTINVNLDIMQVVLFVLALVTRMWRLEYPTSVVFDEVHYMRQVGWYLNRTFFFDHHPPLSKMYFAFAGYLSGYNPGKVYENVGQDYNPDVPIGYLRLFPALFGSLLIPVVYQIIVELGMRRWSAAIAATLVLCENSFLTQSRLVMVESILLFMISFSLLSLLKFLNKRSTPFSFIWWFWLISLGVTVAVTTMTKYIGAMTSCLVLFMAFRDLWYMMADLSYTDLSMVKHTLARVVCLVFLPVALYFGVFYVHLRVLTKAGPMNHVMTSSFQASLEDGLASITKGQPLYVAYGSQVTLHRTFGGPKGCWLHSHDALYPVRYENKRGSSHQQQVTCYDYKDANNWWFINKPDSNDTKVSDPPERIQDGDIVQIYHGLTKRPLNSHDIGAPETPANMEVSCYIDHNVGMLSNTLWRVEIINKYDEGQYWQTMRSHVRLIHVNTTSALRVTGVTLPKWGFGQQEVACDKNMFQDSAIWNVEEHIYPRKEEDREEDLGTSRLIPTEPVFLSFWEKFKELQMKMWSSRVDEEIDHRYASDPSEWPTDQKNVAYWLQQRGEGTSAQIHLLGNIVSWWSALPGFLLFVLVYAAMVLARKRALLMIRADYMAHMTFVAELFIGGYLLNYLPFFTVESTYFLYHYLPAVLFKLMFVAVMVEQVYYVLVINPRLRYLAVGLITAWMTAVVLMFLQYYGVTCGFRHYTNQQLRDMMTFRSWDFIMVK